MGLYRLKPVLRRQLSTAWDSAFNWVLNEPHEHHVALPLTVCLTIATLTLLCGWVRKASIILMCWTGLLRHRRGADCDSEVVSWRSTSQKQEEGLRSIQVAKIDFPDIIALLDMEIVLLLKDFGPYRLSSGTVSGSSKQHLTLTLRGGTGMCHISYSILFFVLVEPHSYCSWLKMAILFAVADAGWIQRSWKFTSRKRPSPPTSPDSHRSVELIYWSFLDISKKSLRQQLRDWRRSYQQHSGRKCGTTREIGDDDIDAWPQTTTCGLAIEKNPICKRDLNH